MEPSEHRIGGDRFIHLVDETGHRFIPFKIKRKIFSHFLRFEPVLPAGLLPVSHFQNLDSVLDVLEQFEQGSSLKPGRASPHPPYVGFMDGAKSGNDKETGEPEGANTAPSPGELSSK